MIDPIALAVIVMMVLLFLKVPVFASILSAIVVYFLMSPEVPSTIAAQRIASGVESIPLLAIPFFVAAGIFMDYTGIARRVMDFAGVLTGRARGGLAHVNIMVSTLMGGMSGSNLADAAMMSKMVVPQMVRKGYSREFSSVVTATGALITPLIPPGIAMIIYGSIANVSIGKLFVSGLGVGLMLAVLLMGLIAIIARKRDYQPMRTEKLRKGEASEATKAAVLALLLPVVIIGGIRAGIFTPTEAGAVAIVYALLLGLLYREMSFRTLLVGIKETVASTTSIMLIVGAASGFAWILTRERIPQYLTNVIVDNIQSKWLFFLLLNLFLLVVGMFIEGNAAMIVLVPLLAPVAASYQIDEIHFAMVFIFNMAIGALTPPVGTLMLVTAGITKVKVDRFIKEALPFYGLLVVMLALLTIFPVLTTGLVELIY